MHSSRWGRIKPLGLDGFPILFYKRFWNIVKHELVALASEAARLDKINYSLVVLVSKTNAPESIWGFRSICLLNCSVKILAKLLENRLKSVLSELVDDSHYGFIAGRSILDGVVVALPRRFCITL